MSDTDSFIDEVTEEVRRDRMYGYLRRYGWIAALAIALIVGGAGYLEFRKSQEQAQAMALGDSILAALQTDDAVARADAVAAIDTDRPTARAILDMLAAAELSQSGDIPAAADRLTNLAENGNVPMVYRNIAGFKALLIQSETLDAASRKAGFGNYAVAGHPMRLLAEEQMALIAAETGDTDGAITQLQSILMDAEASTGLQQRAMQAIVALGGEPDLSALPNNDN